MRKYKIKNKENLMLGYYFNTSTNKILNDLPNDKVEPTIQTRYFNDAVALFLKKFIKIYDNQPISAEDKARIKHLLEKVLEAKDTVNPSEPSGGMYLRKY